MNIQNDLTEAHVAYWDGQTPRVVTYAAPPDDEACSPCTAVVTHPRPGTVVVRVAWKPDEIDLAHLAHGGTIWLSTWGMLPPHMLEVQAP